MSNLESRIPKKDKILCSTKVGLLLLMEGDDLEEEGMCSSAHH
jgi:hypothetical protein